MGCPSANPSRVGTAGPKGLSLCWRSRVIYHVLAHVAHPTGLEVFLGSPAMTFFRCTRCPIHSQFAGAAAWATSTTHPPQPPRVIPGPQVLDSPRGVRQELSTSCCRQMKNPVLQSGLGLIFPNLTHLSFVWSCFWESLPKRSVSRKRRYQPPSSAAPFRPRCWGARSPSHSSWKLIRRRKEIRAGQQPGHLAAVPAWAHRGQMSAWRGHGDTLQLVGGHNVGDLRSSAPWDSEVTPGPKCLGEIRWCIHPPSWVCAAEICYLR